MKIVCVVAIAVIVACALPTILLFIRKRFWRATQAEIVGRKLENRKNVEGERTLHFVVAYRYVVDGVEYFGTDIVPVEVSYHLVKFTVEELAAEFQPGTRIEIYHPSGNPAVSSARRGVVGLPKILFGATAGVFLILVYYFLWYVRTEKG